MQLFVYEVELNVTLIYSIYCWPWYFCTILTNLKCKWQVMRAAIWMWIVYENNRWTSNIDNLNLA